ncbi:MFS transporter [Shigella flexneri]
MVGWLAVLPGAFGLVMPFLPLYVEQLGVTGHSALNMWSGIVFSITFLFWPSPHRFGVDSPTVKAENHAITLCSRHGHRNGVDGTGTKYLAVFDPTALLGLLGGFVPNANALIATQVPRNKAAGRWVRSPQAALVGALLGPMAGGLLADSYGLRPVFFITASVLILCFFVTLFCIEKNSSRSAKRDAAHAGSGDIA